MTYFTEIDWEEARGGAVTAIEPHSVAAQVGIQPGDELLAINGNKVDDVIDVSYYAADEFLDLLIRRGQEYLIIEAEREYGQALGLDFAHPTFDTDIRRCNNLCEFCFVLQMAPRFRRTLYIKDDDYRYSFLFGHFVTLTNLTDHDWWRIETMGLSPLYISVHTTDLNLRRKFLRNENTPDIREQLTWLAEKGIKMHTQIVVVPDFNDGQYLERSIRDLAHFWPSVQSVSVVPVGLTKHHKYNLRTHTQMEAMRTLEYLESVQPTFRDRFGINFVYPTDEWYLVSGQPLPEKEAYDGQSLQENGLGMVRDFLDEWASLQVEIDRYFRGREDTDVPMPGSPHSAVVLVTGKLFAGTLSEVAAEFTAQTGLKCEVAAVTNHRLGDTITCAGLLMASDIIEQIGRPIAGALVVLPAKAFDHPQLISLDDLSPQEVAAEIGHPVALADSMGDVWDALTGRSSLLFDPS